MYEAYWRLNEKPFENTPDPRFLYASSKHEEALMRLLYAIRERKGAAMLTGEYGSGKTLLSRVIWSNLNEEEDRYRIALIVNPAIPRLEFLGEILYQLGGQDLIKPKTLRRKAQILHFLNEMFYEGLKKDQHVVIIVDEAQAILDEAIFEELRLLLNFQLNNRFLLTLILLGQPGLRNKIAKIKQFEQRLSVKYHLRALNQEETKAYIRHRLNIAGRTASLFTEKAYQLIYESSQGIPRQINNLCDLCLVVGFGERKEFIDEDIVKMVAKDFA